MNDPRPVSLRGQGPWKGVNTLSESERGDRMLASIINGYVSKDGNEIRMAPGPRCTHDPVTNSSTAGYRQQTIDAGRPGNAAGSAGTSASYVVFTSPTETMKVWSRETNIHCVENIQGQVLVVGESEMVREPLLAGDGSEITPVSWTNAAHTVITLSAAPTITTNDATPNGRFNAVGAGAFPSFIYFEFDAGGELAGFIHQVRSAVGSTITLETGTSTSGNFNPNSRMGRVRPQQNSTTPKLPVLDSDASYNIGEPFTDPESLTSWRFTDPGNANGSIVSSCAPAFVANRIRDFGDATGELIEGRETAYWMSRRRKKSLPFRLSPAHANDRLLLAAPGYGCCFQIPVIMPTSSGTHLLQDFFRPRSLGVPKAVMYEDTNTTGVSSWHTAGSGYGGTNQAAREGAYKVTVCYRDSVTGELGIAAEPITVTTDGSSADQGLRVGVLFPGYMMAETAAFDILFFRSTRNSTNGLCYFQQAIIPINSLLGGSNAAGRLGLPVPTGATEDQLVVFSAPYVDDANLNTSFTAPDSLHQMPMGSKAVRVIRGQAFFGGRLGNGGNRLERYDSAALLQYDGTTAIDDNRYPNFERIIFEASQATTPEPVSGWRWMLGNGTISPAYEGQTLSSNAGFYPYPRLSAVLNIITNARLAYLQGTTTLPYANAVWPRFTLTETPLILSKDWNHGGGSAAGNQANCSLILPISTVQIALLDNPGQTPATNDLIVDDANDGIEAIGECNGSAVLATRSATYLQQWATDPTVSRPVTISSQFGCVAPNSMTQFDGGCAWLSARGPVASYGGPVQWIGEPLNELFVGSTARYLTDSEGLMRHAWGHHDPERGLVYFGVFCNRTTEAVIYRNVSAGWAASSDRAKSRFACDEILVWNYKINAWSVIQPVSGHEWQWMSRWHDSTGRPRTHVLETDKRIYALDDDFAQWNNEPVVLTLTGGDINGVITGPTTNVSGTFGTSISNRQSNQFVANGMNAMIVGSDLKTMKVVSTVSSFSTGAGTVTLADSFTAQAGDKLYLGVRRMQITTNYLNLTDPDAAVVQGLQVRYSLWSGAQTGGTTTQGPAFIKVTGRVNQILGSTISPTEPTRATGWSNGAWQYMGRSDDLPQSQSRRFGQGLPSGQELAFNIDVIGACQVRIIDLQAMVAP